MAEMFGVVAAGIMLGPELLRLSRSLRKTFRAIRSAPHDVDKLAKEMEIFAGLYEDFLEICSSGEKHNARSVSAVKLLAARARKTIKGITKLLERVQALGGGPLNSKMETLVAYLRWYFSDREVKFLRSSLNVARESIIGFSNVRAVQRLEEQIQLLKEAMAQDNQQTIEARLDISLKEQMRMLKQKSHNRRKQRRVNVKRLSEAIIALEEQQESATQRSDVVPETKQLLQFTKSVEHYIETISPSRPSKQRRRHRSARATTRLRNSRTDSAQPSVTTGTTSFASEYSSSRESKEPSMPGHSEAASNRPSRDGSEESRPHAEPAERATVHSLNWNTESGFVKAIFDDDSARRTRKRYRARNSDGTVDMDPPSPVHSLYEVSAISGDESIGSLPELLVHQTDVLVGERKIPVCRLLRNYEYRFLTKEAGSSLENITWTTTATADATVKAENGSVEQEAKDPEEIAHSHDIMAADDGNSDGISDGIADGIEEEMNDEDTSEKEGEEEEEEAEGAPSPFQPVAGTIGSFPKGWRKRHERSESPQDFWHKRL